MPRALVLAYNFPPNAAIGTMRTLRLVERLAADNWDVRVLTASPASYSPSEPVDPALLARVPASVTVIPVGVWRPYEAFTRAFKRAVPRAASPGAAAAAQAGPETPGKRTVARRAVEFVDTLTSIPDSDAGWIAPVVARGIAVTRRWKPDVLYSTAPPWSAQAAAYLLVKTLRCPWVADFRDPWARAPWREDAPRAAARARTALERRVVHRASAIVFNTARARQEFATHYGQPIESKLHLVANGCDAPEGRATAEPRTSNPFVLLHAGSLYGQRSPVVVMEALAAAIAGGRIARDGVTLRLVGVGGESAALLAASDRLGLDKIVELVPRVSREAAQREMANASAFLLLQQGHALSVPAKTYEYLAVGRPILAIADDGATADLIRESRAGEVVSGADRGEVEQSLLRVIAMSRGGGVTVPRSRYDGALRATELAALLSTVAGCTPAIAVNQPATDPARSRRAS